MLLLTKIMEFSNPEPFKKGKEKSPRKPPRAPPKRGARNNKIPAITRAQATVFTTFHPYE
jgi:hypothetical protein